jgi:RNase P/RNase MRP subunit p30
MVMDNIMVLPESKELLELSKQLGFTKTLFIERDFVLVSGGTKKELLKKVSSAKGKKKLVFYKPLTEEMLRFALEKTAVDLIFGFEMINPKDSVHYLRGALDQVVCKIAASKEKMIGFSFFDILNSNKRAKLMARMRQNMRLCKKYKVKMVFSNFALTKEEMRSAKDLDVFFKVVGK